MITNADITIYNKYYDRTIRTDRYKKTIIRGVNWYGGQKVTVGDNGLLSADSYTVRIPVSSAPSDKDFILPEEFAKLDDGALNDFWTLQNDDLIFRGIGEEIIQPKDVTEKSECFVVTGWSDNRRGSPIMQHWKVEGE